MSTVKLTIDGQEIEVASGTTILEATQELGIEIPTFCHDPELSVHGACRICVVEVEKARTLVAACAAPVAPGMVVHTSSERVLKARRTNLKLILANHPLDCMICEKMGECKLQEYCYLYGIEGTDYAGEKHDYPLDQSNPFIIRDLNKCILCGKCVRKCHEVNGAGAIDYTERGFNSKIAPAFDDPLENSSCVFCGMCIDVCPVGALIPKESVRKGRPWEVQKVKTICPYCGIGCGIELQVKDDKIIGSRPNFKNPVNKGQICVKGHFGLGFVESKERLSRPLIKRKGVFVEAEWDEALDYVAERFKEVKAQSGAEALAGLSSARVTNEENYIFQKLLRMLGTNSIDNCARLCHAPTAAGLATVFGSGAMTNSIEEIENADALLVIGSNITETHPVIGYRVRKAKDNGAKIIVVDSCFIGLAESADVYLSLKPGTNIALLNGLLHVIIEEGLVDEAFIRERTEGFEEVKQVVARYNPEYVAGITGIDAEDIRQAARLYAGAEKASILYTMGITQCTSSTDTVLAIANLAMATGNVGRAFAGVNPLHGQNNVQGACDMGALPNVFTGYQEITEAKIREKFSNAWGVELNEQPGLTAPEIFEAAAKEQIRALYIMGENPVLSDPHNEHLLEALKNLEFLVVQDLFLTETAQYADVVLPAASFAEKEGTFTNTERRVQRIRQAVTPRGCSRPDWQILLDLAKRLGFDWNYSGPEAIMEEIASLTPSYAGISYARLEEGGLQWPCPDTSHPGTKFLHEGQFACGKGVFIPVEHKELAEQPDKEFPFLLANGRNIFHYHTGTMSRRVEGLDMHCPEDLVQINPVDAGKLELKDGDEVRVTSRHGSVRTKVQLTEIVPEGVAVMTFHHRKAAVTTLTNNTLVSNSKLPGLKACAIRIQKVL
ncbi:MAG: formate dehydrogenase subunit alpha [Dethiobacteria bacterium]